MNIVNIIDPPIKCNKFKFMQQVKHVKTDVTYIISEVPRKHFKLEASNESFYSYIAYYPTEDQEVIEWYRCKSEMEDGRFKAV